MADKKISQLTTLAQADVAPTADFLPIVDTGSTETKKATPQAVVLGTLGATTANVGIGTASPTGRLDVVTAGGAVIAGRFYSPSTTNGARLELADNNTNFNVRTMPAGGTTDLSFTRDGTSFEILRLTYSGSVGMGTATPRGDLDVGTSATASTTKAIHIGYSAADFYGFRVANTNTASSLFAGTFAIQRGTGSAWVDNVTVDDNANVTAGGGTLATNATNGFLYVPTCAGTPTGTPTAKTGYAPIVVNTTNNKLYFYSGGAWRDAGP